MILFPYQSFFIISALKPTDIQDKLLESTNLMSSVIFFKSFSKRDRSKIFNGKVLNNSFQVLPEATGRNSFLPLIKGTIDEYNESSRIRIKMTLHPIALIVISAFILGIIAFAINDGFKTGSSSNLENIAPYGMAIGIYCMTVFFFNDESKKAKDMLLHIFDGEVQQQ